MKKFGIYLMTLALVAMTFVACSDDDDNMGSATITAVSEYDIPEDFNQISIAVAIVTKEADAKLESVIFKVVSENEDGSKDTKTLRTITSFTPSNTYGGAIVNTGIAADNLIILDYNKNMVEIIITAKVKDGDESSKTITLKATDDPGPIETPLSDAVDFTLGRPEQDGFPETAMGLTWTTNVDGNTAKFTAAALVALPDVSYYTMITTVEALDAAFQAAEAAGGVTTEFTAQSDANFTDKYLIVKDGAILRLIHMTDLKFAAGANKAYFNEKH